MSEPAPAPPSRGFARDLATFAWRHKLVWLIPLGLLVAIVVMLLFVNYSSAPFHYTVM